MTTFNKRTADSNLSSSFHGNRRDMTQRVHQSGANVRDAIRRLPGILTDQQIKRLKEHKYASEGTTLLDPYMQIFWKRLVEYCPLWVAPNLLTLVGLVINIAMSISLLILTDGAREQVSTLPLPLTSLSLSGVVYAMDVLPDRIGRFYLSVT